MQNRCVRLVPFLELCSKEARDLLTRLLEVDVWYLLLYKPKKRLGRKGAQQILDHAFFKDLEIKKM